VVTSERTAAKTVLDRMIGSPQKNSCCYCERNAKLPRTRQNQNGKRICERHLNSSNITIPKDFVVAAAHFSFPYRAPIFGNVAAPENFERTRWLVELLLQTGHAEEAMTVAEEDGERQEITPEEVATLAETLHKGGAKASAAKMMRELLSRPELTGERRHRLLIRRAGLEQGMVRWRTIIEAIDVLPPGSAQRQASVDLILAELKNPDQIEQAGLLAESTKDKQAQADLLLRQADLYVLRSNARAAAEVGWSLYAERRLPADRFNWLVERLRAAHENGLLIQFVEDGLRHKKALSNSQLDALAAAYNALGRPADAERARTNPREHKP
jgi:hypothetical protein